MTAPLLIAAAAAFALASVFFLLWLVRYDLRARRVGAGLTIVGTALLGLDTAVELALDGAGALGVGPRILLVVTLGVTAVFLASRLRRDLPLAGPVIAPLAAATVLALAVKALRGDLPSTGVVMGALTVVHIASAMLGFLLFLPAYVLSVLFLSQEYDLRTKQPSARRLPGLRKLETMSWQLLSVGFPLYSVGVLMGFVWQEQARPAFRPEHALAAVAWGIYAYATYKRLRYGWRGRRAAVTLVVGFAISLSAVLLYVMR